MVKRIKNYLSLVKFSHTIFAMPFAFIGFFLAIKDSPDSISIKLLLLVLLCMVFARNAAMSFNRLVDRHYDLNNPRTNQREIPKGVITPKASAYFTLINSILFIATTYFINHLVLLLSPIALFVVLFYSYTKRFTWLCHFVLGLGLSLAPIGAYLAVTGKFNLVPLLYSFIVFFWVAGFDIIYALQDESFDKSQNLKSIPAKVGIKKALHIATLLHIVVAAIVLLIGIKFDFNIWYWLGSLVFITLLGYQHFIVSPNDLSRVNIAFATTNGIASIIYSIFNIISYLT
ncbi:MAG: 4-hydroxybenzoate octaprenyltransferase [Bacteroidales bacterium]|nr:MAG: 4-hydroxybenzoate octaprenyltransferase [Bacteroidales bacterium]